MTDKQIIIDGEQCEYLRDTGLCRLTYCLTEKSYDCSMCKDNPNCYYKQLKAKEQECKDLKKINKKLKHSFKELNVYIEKAQEWLKKQKSNDIFIDEMKAILLEELKCLKKK
jgi:hypothetical protein